MDWIIEHIKSKGEQVAIIYKEREFSYRQLSEQIKKYSDEVFHKIPQGAVVAIISDYSFESIALFFALYHNRNIIVPITSKISTIIEERLNVSSCSYSISFQGEQLIII